MPGEKRYDITDNCFKDLKRKLLHRLKPPAFPDPMVNFLKEIKDDDVVSLVSTEDQIIPIDKHESEKTSAVHHGRFVGRRRTHDEMPDALKDKQKGM
jgi:hypothetical protein